MSFPKASLGVTIRSSCATSVPLTRPRLALYHPYLVLRLPRCCPAALPPRAVFGVWPGVNQIIRTGDLKRADDVLRMKRRRRLQEALGENGGDDEHEEEYIDV